MSGLLRRPYLTENNFIHGVGKLIKEPKETELYMRGYLSGMIQGDGLLKSYNYSGKRRGKDIQYQFRLVLKDKNATVRTYDYLNKFGIKTNWFKFEISKDVQIDAIRINSQRSYQKIKKLIEFNSDPEYLRGFAAGIFDAEGHGGSKSSTIRIFNTDTSLLQFTKKSLENLGFRVVDDKPNKNNCKIMRIRGSLDEYIRFFQTTNPAIKRKIVLGGKQVKKSFKVKKIIDLREIREMYDITTGTGTFIANGLVSHNCYARFMKRFTNHHEPWGEFVDAKINAPLILEKEIRRKPRGEVFVSSVCDPYQPLEEKYQLTRKCLRILVENEFPITILTKSSLVKRDFNILKDYPQVELGLTITTMDENLKEKIEPHSSSSEERISVLEEASKLGIKTYCFLGPFLPFIGDREESLKRLFKAILSLNLDHIYVDRLNPRFGVWESLYPFLKRFFPETISKVGRALFNRQESENYSSELHQRVENIAKSFHLLRKIRLCF